MTVSFHHHLRDGDHVLPMVMSAIERMGFKDIKVSASSIHNSHGCLADLIKKKVVTGLDTNFVHSCVGETLSKGHMEEPAIVRTHGNRPHALETGEIGIDIAFVAASAADEAGNMNGIDGQSSFGSMGLAYADAWYAKKVVCVTDYLVSYPLTPVSIPEIYVDYVVKVDCIGDPKGIASGITKVTQDALGLMIAKTAADAVIASGYLKDGFAFQTGGGRISLAATQFLKAEMLKKKIVGSFILGGLNSLLVDLHESGLFETIMDCQCLDLKAVESLKKNPNHQEISAAWYADHHRPSCVCKRLDAVILGATEIDTDFNVNVHTDSNGIIMGGSGGHSDIANGAKLTIVVTPLVRARTPIVVDRVTTKTTPGSDVDVLVTQRGVAVNPARGDLAQKLKDAGLPVKDIGQLRDLAQKICGQREPTKFKDKVVAIVKDRLGLPIDQIRQVYD
jgi:citrate lyase subunit alpha/citrate CoA-transferase